jgi:preprotein translocase subunit YajC
LILLYADGTQFLTANNETGTDAETQNGDGTENQTGTEASTEVASGDTSSQAASGGGSLQMLTMVGYIAIFGAVMYLFIFRPQKKKKKQEEALRKNIQIGDEIVTIGGVFGRIVSLKEDSVIIESTDHSKTRVARWAIQTNNTLHDDK